MASTYSNVGSTGRSENERVTTDAEQQRLCSTQGYAEKHSPRHFAQFAAGLAVVAIVGSALALASSPSHAPLRGVPSEAETAVVALNEDSGCRKLWEQCGGIGYDGPTCCEEGSECTHKPLLELSSYRQCMRPGEEKCGDVEPGSQCAKMMHSLKWDVERTPENFKGLWTGMDDKEYQLYAHWGIWDESHCPEPCADGTCFVVLHIQGCDTLDDWYCSHDDGSLKYACCCKYFMEEKALDKPENIDEDMKHAIEVVEMADGPELFCTAMVQPTGPEIWLLRAQYQQGKLGMFACEYWSVYSNVSMTLSPDDEKPVQKTTLIKGSLSSEVGGNWSTALNTEVFIRFWDRVIADPKSKKADWIVKIDPDAVWFPVRLRVLLRTRQGPLSEPEPETGLWLNNCYLGLHGPIEVVSKNALQTYNSKQDMCQHGKVSKIGQEDYFLRECFKKIGIQKVDAFNLLLESDFACGEHASAPDDKPPCFDSKVAFHPFKSVNTWMRCHKQAANHPWNLPVVPASEPPSEANAFHAMVPARERIFK